MHDLYKTLNKKSTKKLIFISVLNLQVKLHIIGLRKPDN